MSKSEDDSVAASEGSDLYGHSGTSTELLQAMATAITVRRLYPAEHPSCLRALERLVSTLEPFYGEKGRVFVDTEEGALRVNKQEVRGAADLAAWLSGQMRRRLIKGFVVDSQVEPNELAALCGLMAERLLGLGVDDLRERLKQTSGEHVKVHESAYSRDVVDASIDDVTAGQEWLLAMSHTAASLVLPLEAKALVERLEDMSVGEEVEEADVVGIVAECASKRFGGAIPDDSYRMELLLTHTLGALKHETEGGAEEPSTFRRRELLGMLVQRILGRTPGLIGAIAESSGPLLGQIRARSIGRNPGEVLRHLFMRTPGKGEVTMPEETRSDEQPAEEKSDTVDAAILMEGLERLSDAGGLPDAIRQTDLTGDFVGFLTDLIASEEAPSRRERARERLRELIADEIDRPGKCPASVVLNVLSGGEDDRIGLAARQALFSGVDSAALLDYLERELTTDRDRVSGLRAALEVLGDDVIDEIVQRATRESDHQESRSLVDVALGALAKEIAFFLTGLKGDRRAQTVRLAIEVSQHLDTLEQAQLLSALVAELAEEAPEEMIVYLARVPSAIARRALREWVAMVPQDRRRAFARKLLSERDAAAVEATVDIAAGMGAWRKMYPERQAAIQTLGSTNPARARDVLSRVAREGRWSLSGQKRSCARLARTVLARLARKDSAASEERVAR